MNNEKSLALKISEIEERLENRSAAVGSVRTLLRSFGEVALPNGEHRLTADFFCERGGSVELDLFLNAGAERACEVSLVADGAVLARMCSSIKYSDRIRRSFYCGAGEHTLEICFVNRDSAFVLCSAAVVLSGCLRPDGFPAAASCNFGGERFFAVSAGRETLVLDESLTEVKRFSFKSDRIALADTGSLTLFYLRGGDVLCRSVFAQASAVTLVSNATDFCFMPLSQGAGALYFVRDKKLFRSVVDFSGQTVSVSQETAVELAFSDKALKVRVLTDDGGDSVIAVQGQSNLYLNGSRFSFKGMEDAFRSADGKIGLLLAENGLASVVEVNSADFKAGEKRPICYCDAACFADADCLFVVRDKKAEKEYF